MIIPRSDVKLFYSSTIFSYIVIPSGFVLKTGTLYHKVNNSFKDHLITSLKVDLL